MHEKALKLLNEALEVSRRSCEQMVEFARENASTSINNHAEAYAWTIGYIQGCVLLAKVNLENSHEAK